MTDNTNCDLECNKLIDASINNMTTNKTTSIEGSRESSSSNISDNLSQSLEKCDISPENSKKSDDCELNIESEGPFAAVVPMEMKKNDNSDRFAAGDQHQTTKDVQHIPKSISLQDMSSLKDSGHTKDGFKSKLDAVVNNVLRIEEDNVETPSKPNAMAFTIDFGESKSVDNVKYKNMVERFQNRHKRGQSLSKIEDNNNKKQTTLGQVNAPKARPPMSAKLPRKLPSSNASNSESSFSSEQEDYNSTRSGGVILRDRDKKHRDVNKRHSWSPRTSALITNEPVIPKPSQMMPPPPVKNVTTKFTPRSATLTLALKNKEDANKFELECPVPPLENLKCSADGDDDSVSDAGTYTLDGDNYTEEQKEKMNIDRVAKEEKEKKAKAAAAAAAKRAVEDAALEIIDLDEDDPPDVMPTIKSAIFDLHDESSPRKNILEISYYHTEPTNIKSKISYLDKIKARVKNISKSKAPEITSPDMGSFTSVTTCGVLSVKPNLERNPKLLTRKNSLTKSQIDSSEYVQGVSRYNLKCDDDTEKTGTSYTETSDENNEIKIVNYNNQNNVNNTNNNLSKTSLKTAATKIDWIQEWAKNAREYAQNPQSPTTPQPPPSHPPPHLTRHTQESSQYPISKNMSRSFEFENQNRRYNGDGEEDYSSMTKSSEYSNYDDEFGDNLDRNYGRKVNNIDRHHNIANVEYYSDPNLKFHRSQKLPPLKNLDYRMPPPTHSSSLAHHNNNNYNVKNSYGMRDYDFNTNHNYTPMELPVSASRPPMSPSKIPSPIHSISRARGSSRNRSRNASNTDLTYIPNDTEMYLMKTADAISTLQNIHKQNSLHNSPQSPSSPVHKISPIHSVRSPLRGAPVVSHNRDDDYPVRYKNLHQRNASLDGSEIKPKLRLDRYGMSNSYNSEGLNQLLDMNKSHTRHHSYEGMSRRHIDQTHENTAAMRPNSAVVKSTAPAATNSPIRRSNSFSKKQYTPKPNTNNQHSIKKSASSTSFRKMIGGLAYENDNVLEYYINDDDDLIDDHRYRITNSSDSESSGIDMESKQEPPITNTRCNKAFLMRMEQNKKQPLSSTGSGGSGGNILGKQGVIACPNTPEFRRRDSSNIRQSFRDRASMPRDSSLSRMKQELPNLNSTKKNLTSSKEKIQPKYLDISKYKPAHGANFLKKDESKSYLAHREVRRSPSATSVNLSRNDTTRTSNRSVKSAGARPSQSQIQAQKTKEAELAMWKRRAGYDPMKAAAEDRKRKEDAKRQAQQSKLCESSVVLRSQSFHSGVANNLNISKTGANYNNRWTLTSNESSDEDDYTINP